MKKDGFSSRVAAAVLSLAMVFSMASPLTVLAEEPAPIGAPAAEAATPETASEEVVPATPYAQAGTEEEPLVAHLFSMEHGDIGPYINAGASSITVTPAGSTVGAPLSEGTTLNYGDRFTIDLAWTIPNTLEVHNGDTFTYTLPSTLSYTGVVEGPLKDGVNTVGTYKVEGSALTLTYTQDMLSGLVGTVNLQGVIDTSSMGGDNGGVMAFSFPGIYTGTNTVNRNDSKDNLKISKTMSPAGSDKYLQDVVIAVEATGPQSNINVTDVMGSFLSYKEDSFKVYADAACTTPYADYSGSWDNVTFPSLEDQTVYIKYQVDVDKKLSGYDNYQWDSDRNKNSATGTTEGKDNNPGDNTGTAIATVDKTWNVGKNGVFDETSGNATWTITIDPGNDTDITGTKIKEMLGADIEDPTSIVLQTAPRDAVAWDAGTDILSSWDSLKSGDYTLSGTNQKYQITIVTPLKDIPTVDSKNYTNTVNVTPYGDGRVETDTGTIGVGEHFDALSKTCLTESTSAATLDWQASVSAPAGRNLTNAYLCDVVENNHTLDKTTIVVKKRGVDTPLTAGTDYTIEYKDKDGNPNANAFYISFASVEQGTTIDVTYQTNVNASVASDTWLSNKAYLKATELGSGWTEKPASHEYKVNIEKRGSNAENGKFTWYVTLKNFSATETTPTVKVEDTLPENNTFVEGSVSVKHSDWPYEVYDGVTATVSSDKKKVTFAVEGTALATLLTGKKIEIQYNTILTNPSLLESSWNTFTNRATAIVNDIPSNPVIGYGYTGKPEVLKKELNYNATTAPAAEYVVDVNAGGLDLAQGSETLTLKDTMGTGLQLLANTVQVSADGGSHYTPIGSMGAPYSLTYNQGSGEITFVVPDSTPLKIKYSLLVTLAIGETFNAENGGNKIELSGSSTFQGSSTTNLNGSVLKSSGTSTSEGFAIQIYKYEYGKPTVGLAGAHFKIEQMAVTPTVSTTQTHYAIASTAPVVIKDNLISGENGNTPGVGGLREDTIYRVTETQAPAGYQVTAPYYVVFQGTTGPDWTTATLTDNGVACILNTNNTATCLCYAANKPAPETSVQVTKVWNDNNDADHKRPAITSDEAKELMTLVRSAGDIPKFLTTAPTTIVDNGNNTWTYTWSGLPQENALGTAYEYTVAEDESKVPDYAASLATVESDGTFTVTNTYPKPTEDKVSISITKQWVDNGSTLRPAYDSDDAKGMMTLYIGESPVAGAPSPTITDNTDGTWTYTWSGLDKEDSDGIPYLYSVKETAVPTGYKASPAEAVANGQTITNTLETVDIHITKQWNDNGNAGGKRPAITSDDAKAMMALYIGESPAAVAPEPAVTKGSDNSWIYTWSDLTPLISGEYTVKEVNVPTGYTASTTEGVANAGTITNTLAVEYGKISVTKVDATNTATKLAEAVFGVYTDAAAATPAKVDGANVTITTTTAGADLSVNLPVGTYYVKETSAPAGYNVNSTIFKVKVTRGNTTAVMTGANAYVADTKTVVYGKISVTKVDAENTDTKLANATFGVYATEADANSATNAVKYITTGTDGTGISVDLPIGTYYVKEATAPTGYNLNNSVFTVAVTEGATTAVMTGANAYVADTKTEHNGKISVTKVDADNPNIKLSGAKFGVYTNAAATIPAKVGGTNVTITTAGTTGTGISVDLPVGTYYVKETVAPTNYDLNSNVFKVEVTEGNTTPVKTGYYSFVKDEKSKGKISVTKVDAENTTTKLAGAIFGVYTDSEANTPATVGATDVTITTAATGIGTSVDLPVGTYYVKETTAPTNYELNTGIFTVAVTKGTTTAVNADTTSYVTDTKSKGKISVTKVDAENTDTKLAGAIFGVYTDAEANTPAKVGTNDVTITTAATGTGTSVDLPVGTYYVKEKNAPVGYILDNTVHEVVVEKGATVAVTNNDSNTFGNAPTKVSVSKVAVTGGAEIAGAKLKVIDAEGNIIDSWTSVANEKHEINGKLDVDKTYTLVEVTAPFGYELASDIPFTVHTDGSVTPVEMIDEACLGSATITKHSVNTDGAKLEGCSYILYREKDSAKQYYKGTENGCAAWTATRAEALALTTGADGTATATGLPMGNYFFQEIDPPAGHLIDETPIPVEVTVENATDPAVAVPVAQADPITKVSVSKVAVTGGAEIAGAKLKVIDETGKVVDEWTSEANKVHEINGKLNPGKKYTLVEVTAPFGYELASNIPFTVSTDGTVNKVEMIDEACLGSATITKHSVNTDGAKLEGCSYILYREKNNTKQYYKGTENGCAIWTATRAEALALTTGKDGTATATGLPMGNYFFQEITPPAGHLIDETPIPVEVTVENATDPAVAVPVAQADPKIPDTPTPTPTAPSTTPAPSATPTPSAPTVTPTATPAPTTVIIPKTADNSQPMLYVFALVASMLGLAGVYVAKRRKD